jgi:hypothetical protein
LFLRPRCFPEKTSQQGIPFVLRLDPVLTCDPPRFDLKFNHNPAGGRLFWKKMMHLRPVPDNLRSTFKSRYCSNTIARINPIAKTSELIEIKLMNITQLIERVKAILLTPKTAWDAIKADGTTVSGIYMEYLVPLAAVPAVASFIGHSIIGISLPFVGHFRQPFFSGLIGAIVFYVLTLIGIFVAAKVIDVLAPTFGANKNGLNAFKVAAYAWTPALVAGILSILPVLSPLALLLSLYSFYLLYLGLGKLMSCPAEKTVGYTVVSIISMVVIYAVIGLVMGSMMAVGTVTRGGASQIGATVAEKIVQANLAGKGVKAKMNIDEGKLTIQTKEGTATYAGGAGTQIPDTFPKDIYVPEGATVIASITVPQGCNVTLNTKTAAAKVLASYKEKMTASGWSEAMSLNQGDQSMVTFQKDKRTTSVVISKSDNQTQIILTAVEEKENDKTESKEE